ncbi:stage VI sporulation protein D [Aquibacillus sp. 3ASR75-11]|uniref:Stage VI sporulation protein D n=1 Tax=Terrihalobacillus insolitus TaxID=2950438 RepID=A0A9X3WSL0_9BACI|nr:stage VI sporulation protein D [Terrihalobacillus insolitus]MDC3412484.1 stage VI sporulation protein D [Terrihalobacillus insolitus]MDC3423903.1 stage VI sporulation protein D [Terrihalobacillus insolitus]
MTYEDPSVFTFELDESLWFKKGQEVDELMGVSLEPEISIQEFNDYVQIRGVIELKGEYFQVKEDLNEEEEQVLSLRDYPSKRLVERVESYEDGVNEFFHRFPVEISVPQYRVHSLEDVMVGIETFDYELPERSQLKLSATVAIHGVRDEETALESSREENQPNVEEDLDQDVPFDDETIDFEFKEEVPLDVPENELTEGPLDTPELEEPAKKKEKNKWKNKKTQSFAEFFGKNSEKKLVDDIVEPFNQDESDIFNDSPVLTFEEQGGEVEEDQVPEREEEKTNQDASYLLNIFDNKKEQERYAKMKMCIVQDSDTLISIAERYDVSPLQITKSNKLEEDDVLEGQILYIPIKEK